MNGLRKKKRTTLPLLASKKTKHRNRQNKRKNIAGRGHLDAQVNSKEPAAVPTKLRLGVVSVSEGHSILPPDQSAEPAYGLRWIPSRTESWETLRAFNDAHKELYCSFAMPPLCCS